MDHFFGWFAYWNSCVPLRKLLVYQRVLTNLIFRHVISDWLWFRMETLMKTIQICWVLSCFVSSLGSNKPSNLSPLLCRWRAWRGGGWWTVTMKTGPWNPKPNARSAGKLQCRASVSAWIPKFGAIHLFLENTTSWNMFFFRRSTSIHFNEYTHS